MARPLDQPRILVVDDEENIRFLLVSALTHFGFDVQACSTGQEALQLTDAYRPDLVVLDVMMPDVDGFSVLRRMRAVRNHTPVLFLTARDASEDAVHGLTLGADDYVKKPFSLEEVVARVRTILRRVGGDSANGLLRFEDLEMDDDAHVVRRGGQIANLSPTEYKLLRYLLINAGRVLSRSQILDHVWEYDWAGEASVVETYVSYLRKKLDPLGPPLIKTVRGIGYVLRADG
jgi:two-component system OmpR family response regulator